MKKYYLFFAIAIAYSIVVSILGYTLEKPGLVYLCELAVVAMFLASIGWEDFTTLKVSWKKTGLYAIICIPPVLYGIHWGYYMNQYPAWSYLVCAAFVISMIIYSLVTGRGGADRDIGFITAIAFPNLAAIPIVIALLISVMVTAIRKQKFPFLAPFAIVFIVIASLLIIYVLQATGWMQT